jgi:lipopolysaccharide/colanic/teichoic acid biosynthesis glycosyltransferase
MISPPCRSNAVPRYCRAALLPCRIIAAHKKMKRLFDITLTLFTTPLWLPLLAGVACAVWFCLGSPVLFIQERPGLKGKVFRLFKFRTMRLGDAPDAKRLTRLGRFLRATSLDELPELINVLKGEMSLVGPRPLLVRYLSRYTPEQMRRHEVRPGLTGWAQINGRNALSWEQKFAYDVWYVDHWTFGLDLKILCLTAWRVLTRHGITAAGEATMGEFTGAK